MSKSVRLDEDVYERIKAHKQDGETFSEAVERLIGPIPLRELGGLLSEAAVDDLEDAIEETDRRSRDDMDGLVEEFDQLRDGA